jgi:hypothetical protein
MAEELGTSSEFIRSGSFHSSDMRGTVLQAVTTLEKRGLVDAKKVLGPWMERPTSEGRERFKRWQDEWAKNQQQQDRLVQRRVLELLATRWSAEPQHHQEACQMSLDVPALCRELDATEDDIVANLQRLASQGKVGRHSQYDTFESRPWADGDVYITEASSGVGLRAIAAGA